MSPASPSSSLACNSYYYYNVAAVNSAGLNYAGASLTAKTIGCPPAAPSNLRTIETTPVSITIGWDDNSNNEATFYVYAWRDTGWTLIASTGPNVTNYTESSLSCGSYHYYLVAAVNTTAITYASTSLTAIASPCVLAAPTNLRTIETTPVSITIGWDDNSNNEATFYVYAWRDTEWTLIVSTGPNVTSYTDSSLTCGSYYAYTVAAVNTTAITYASTPLTAITSPCGLAAPTNLRTIETTPVSITIGWDDNSNNEATFYVYAWRDSGWTLIVSTGPNVTSYTDFLLLVDPIMLTRWQQSIQRPLPMQAHR